MATTYVGFYRPDPSSPAASAFRDTGAPPPAFGKKVNEFAKSLPATCKLVGSWGVSGNQAPSVIVVEAESYADLQHINTYYRGWLLFDWHPAAPPRRDW